MSCDASTTNRVSPEDDFTTHGRPVLIRTSREMSLDEASDLNGEGWHRLEVLLPRRQSTGGVDDQKAVTRDGRLLAG